ncbi:LamG domain-containing protein [Hanstruepera ponticola]|uniref:LamG domain-containing protein n=1 Tax=Hanstruepera ponticola TaxID=2042995 RepID=UPI000CF12B8B|nr:LamG domain-containing protein [Hanstruepera ponticola]
MKFRLSLLLLLMMLFVGVSCQEEANEETPPNQEETIAPNSTLANLMRHTSSNDGTIDNIMDGSDCFSVNLPVTIVANGITLTIESIDDFSLIEAIFNENMNDEDSIEFLFPVTIILNDYTEINIESVEELDTFIESCVTNEDVIECVDFVYPLVFSIYNTNFQVIDTVEVNNDYELYIFLEGLETDNQGAVLASLNFPVSLVYVNGNTVEVTNNQELEEAISAANENCDTDCTEEFVVTNLQECLWNITSYNNTGDLSEYYLNFKGHDSLQVTTSNFSTIEANWVMSSSNTGSPELVISNFIDDVNGSWLIDSCDEEVFQFTQTDTITGNENTMVLEQDCELYDLFSDCYMNLIDSSNFQLMSCDENNDGLEVFNLTEIGDSISCSIPISFSYYTSSNDAYNQVNQIPNPESYESASGMVFILIKAFYEESYYAFPIDLIVRDCGDLCSEEELDAYLVECIWNVVDFDNSNDLAVYDLDFNSDGTVVITGNGLTIVSMWSTSQSGSGTIVEFSNVAGPDIQAISGSWLIVECNEDRLVMESINSISEMVMEQDCANCDNPGILTDDLVIYIPFSNETNDLMNDSAEVIIGTGSYVEDRAGNVSCATAFDGTQSVEVPVSAFNQIVQGDSFTISVWFKMQNTNAGNLEVFFRKPGNATVGFNLGVYDLNTPLFFDNLNTSLWDNDWNQEVDVIWDNTDWHHLVVTVDSNNTVRLYRDGVLRNINESSDLSIGADPTSHYLLGEGFQGHLDDLRVYKRTLSDNEVGDLYNLEADCYTCL